MSRISGAHVSLLALIGLVGGVVAHPPDRSPPSSPHRGTGTAAAAGSGSAAEAGHTGAYGKPSAAHADRGHRTVRSHGGAHDPPGVHAGPPGSVVRRQLSSAPARALADASRQLVQAEVMRAATARSWGLRSAPLRPPPPPAGADGPPDTVRDLPGEPGLAPVLTRVPTTDRVIFLTIDDGSRQDPELLRMVNDLQVPFSAFLTDDEVGTGYGYFRELRRLGVAMHNHALVHRYLPGLPYPDQLHQICGQQRSLLHEMGEAPRLFRPPYGGYNADTLRAAAMCGVSAVPLWSAEAFPDRIEYSEPGERLRPGDIILTHFRGPAEWDGDMPDVVRRVLATATAQGFAVARLEDYL